MYGVKQPIIAISLDEHGMQYYFTTMLEASKVINGQVSHISECINGLRHTHKRYKFIKANHIIMREGDFNE